MGDVAKVLRAFLDGEGIKSPLLKKQPLEALYCALGPKGALIGSELCLDDVECNETVTCLKQRFGNRHSKLINIAKFF